jgi:N-methylhydantoinase A
MLIGVDIGGTFTDFAIVDEATGEVETFKVPSTHGDPLEAIRQGLTEADVDLTAVRRFLHGTTIGTNAVLEGRGAKTALITTEGFRDHIEIGDNLRYTGGLFDPHWQRTRPLVPMPLRFEVSERILGDGSVATPLDRAGLQAAVDQLVANDVESVAVCFLNSYKNPQHETRAGREVRRAGGIDVSLSAEVVPEWREYARFSTAVLNAYVMPLLRSYLDDLVSSLRAKGCTGEVLFMSSSAGLVSRDTATSFPVRLILSGPAAGVEAGIRLGELTGRKNLITYDMGGTSTDVCLIENLSAAVSSRRVLLAYPIMTPMVDVETVGAGGGSVVHVDPTGALRVGPESAGAEPGPASYGKGGAEFTVTDANLLLGRLSPVGLGGGRIPLDRDRAQAAADRLNANAGFPDTIRLADAAIQITVTNMCAAVREISVQRGHDPREFALVPFGGAGPMHAVLVAEELGIPTIVVPSAPGNVCATGLLSADLRHDLVHSVHVPLAEVDATEIEGALRTMQAEGRDLLAEEGVKRGQIVIQHVLSLRYAGQSFELDVPLGGARVSIERISADFDALHLKRYGYDRAGHPLELVHLRVSALGMLDKPQPRKRRVRNAAPRKDALTGRRPVYLNDAFVESPVYDRAALAPGARFQGPAIVEEPGSVTIVFPKWRAAVDGYSNIVLERASRRPARKRAR